MGTSGCKGRGRVEDQTAGGGRVLSTGGVSIQGGIQRGGLWLGRRSYNKGSTYHVFLQNKLVFGSLTVTYKLSHLIHTRG